MRSRPTFFFAFVSAAMMATWLPGCGPTNGLPPVSGEFLYVANFADGTISEFSINTSTGVLTNVGSYQTASTDFGLGSLTMHPTNEFIYATDSVAKHLFGFDIGDQTVEGQDYNGRIFMPNTDTPSTAALTAITGNGKFLYASSSNNRTIGEYSINLVPGTPEEPNQENGLLTPIGSIATDGAVRGVAIDAGGRYVYVVDPPQKVLEFVVQADGILTPIGSLTIPGASSLGVANIAISRPGPSTECAYVTGNGLVYELAINTATGALSSLGSVSLNGSDPTDIEAHPNGKFVYAAADNLNNGSTISLLNVSTSCSAALATQLSLPEFHATKMTIEPSGKFAYAANVFLGTIDEFSINQTSGALGTIGVVDSESPAKPGSFPIAIVTTH